MSADKPEQEPVTVTDKRRIDPETFEANGIAAAHTIAGHMNTGQIAARTRKTM